MVNAGAAGAACPACRGPMPDGRGPLRMRTCASCGTVSAWPLPSPEDLAAYYNGDYQVVHAHRDVRARRNWEELLDAVERRVAGRRGLELGSSHGAFLRLAAGRGWDMIGVELDARAREQHARLTPDIPAYETPAEARGALANEFDCIWALHTIEHLPEPEAALRELHAMLRRGGVLAITTPNAGSLERALLGPAWEWWTPPAHLALFSPRGLRLVLERAGFDDVRIETRRGDSAGLAANVALAPVRLAKRLLGRNGPQQSSARSAGQRLARLVNSLYDPASTRLRWPAYRRLLGPELVALARRPVPRL